MKTILAAFACLTVFVCPSSIARADEPTDPRRPLAIATSQVPVVSAALAERLRQYQNTRSAVFAGWSPDGRGILVQTRFGNSMQLHRVYEPSGRREQVTFFDEPTGGRFIPEAKDGSLLVTMSRGGSENDQVYFLDQTAYRTALLTDGKSRNLLGPLGHDGRRMIVLSNQRNGRDMDLFVADCRQPASQELLMKVENQFWTAADWSLDGEQLLLSRYVSINESYPAVFDVSAKSLRPLPLPTESPAAVGTMAFSPDRKYAYLTTDARGEFLELARLDLKTHEYAWPAGKLDWDVSDVVVERGSGLVAFTVNADGASRLYLLDGDRRREVSLPLGVVAGLAFSPDGSQLGFTLARPDAPAEAYSIAIADGKLVRWTY
ncbi:MAG TPA: S9 family peptidase, partial [Pirellulales bacterium]|nr:S9 family peptidase [Pirellulales bacterium]